MKKLSDIRREEKGAVLIISLLVTVAMLIVVMPFLFKVSGQYRTTDKSFKSYAALNLAEAGVEMAIWELNHGHISDWEGTVDERTLTLSSIQASGGSIVGDVSITISDPGGDNPVILSSGKIPFRNSDTIDKTLRVVVNRDTKIMFASALFASDELNFAGNSTVDGYDSRLGEYNKDNDKLDVTIGVNSTHFGAITLSDKAKVVGDALIGYEGDPDNILLLDKAKVTGEKNAFAEPQELLPIEAPQGLPWRGEIDSEDGTFEISESGEYSLINLGSGGQVTITEDVTLYITGDLSMANGSKFIVEEGVNVQLYLASSFHMEHGSQFNKTSEDPTDLQIWGTESFTGDFYWGSESEFCGAVYVPQGNIILTGNMEYYGAVAAKTIYIDANTKLHYDIALQDIQTPYYQPFFTVLSWQEKLVP